MFASDTTGILAFQRIAGNAHEQRHFDWDLPDPAGLSVEQVRPIRDDISHRVEQLLAELVATHC